MQEVAASGQMRLVDVRVRPAAWLLSLTALVLIRLAMWSLLLNNVPPIMDHYDHWHFHHGGDQGFFFGVAQNILAGQPKATTVGVGLPLLMAMLMRFVNAVDYDGILPLIVIGNGALFGLMSVPVMASLAYSLTGSRKQALAVGLMWTLLPYLLWAGFGLHPMARDLRNAYVPRQMWVTGITDGPSLFFLTLGMLVALRGPRDGQRESASAIWLVIGGACMGFAMAIRIHVAAMVFVMLAALVWSRQWRNVLWMFVGLLLGFAPQFWHNAVTAGHPFTTPYFSGWFYFTPDWVPHLRPTGAPFSPSFLFGSLATLVRRLPLLVGAGVLVAAFGAYAFVRCGSKSAIIMFGAPLASLAIHIVTFVYVDDPVRFALPAFTVGLPALIWTASAGLELFNSVLRKKGIR